MDQTAMPPQHGTTAFDVRPLTPEDKPWVQETLKRYWSTTTLVTRGRPHQGDELPGFVASQHGERVGLLTYDVRDGDCEIVTHNAIGDHAGVGTCLLAAVRSLARERGCGRLWCVTTNDNPAALRFYQRREFDLVALHRNAVDQARAIKPQIPVLGRDGIRLRHEIELEYRL